MIYYRLAAGSFDFGDGRLGEGISLDRKGGLDLSVAKYLDAVGLPAETGRLDLIDTELLESCLCRYDLEVGEVDGRILDPGGIVESELGDLPLDRHLAAFKTNLVLVTGASLRALVAACGSAAFAGTLSAAQSHIGVGRTNCGCQIV